MITIDLSARCKTCEAPMHSDYDGFTTCLNGHSPEPLITNPPPPDKEWNRKDEKARCKNHPEEDVFNNSEGLCHQCNNNRMYHKRKGRPAHSYGVQGAIWCTRDDCEEPAETKGLCRYHYRASTKKPCSTEGCETIEYAKKVCHRHYRQMLKEQEVIHA